MTHTELACILDIDNIKLKRKNSVYTLRNVEGRGEENEKKKGMDRMKMSSFLATLHIPNVFSCEFHKAGFLLM